MKQTVPFTWTAFVERMLDDHQYAFAEHPWQSFPHPVLPFVTRVRGIVYVSSRQNLLLADPRIHALGQRRLTELSDSELTRMKTQRENPPEAPLGWARVRKSVLLYVRNRTAIPGGIAAHILGRHDRHQLLWHAEDGPPEERPNPIVIDYADEQRPALAYIMPASSEEIPAWSTLAAKRPH